MTWIRDRRRPSWNAIAVVIVIVAGIVFWRVAPDSYIYTADTALLAAISALALNLLTGYAGQVSIGNAAFLAIGAYTVVLTNSALPFPVPVILGALLAGAVGFLIGLPSLRLRGLYLIFSTLALHFVIVFAIVEYDSKTGAVAGHALEPPTLGPVSFSDDQTWFVTFAIILAAVATFVWNVSRGRLGRAFGALRANEASAAVMGIDIVKTKLAVFTASSVIVGFAGGIGAYFLQVVSSDYYSLGLAISYIAMILIGGLASVWGAVIGAFVVTAIPFILQNISTSLSGGSGSGFLQSHLSIIDTLVYGLLILLFLYFRPAGIASLSRRRNRSRVSQASEPGEPSERSLPGAPSDDNDTTQGRS